MNEANGLPGACTINATLLTEPKFVQHLEQRSLGPSVALEVKIIMRNKPNFLMKVLKWTKYVFDIQKGFFLFQCSQLCLFDLQPKAWRKAACTLILSSTESTASQNLHTLSSPALPRQSIYERKCLKKKNSLILDILLETAIVKFLTLSKDSTKPSVGACSHVAWMEGWCSEHICLTDPLRHSHAVLNRKPWQVKNHTPLPLPSSPTTPSHLSFSILRQEVFSTAAPHPTYSHWSSSATCTLHPLLALDYVVKTHTDLAKLLGRE